MGTLSDILQLLLFHAATALVACAKATAIGLALVLAGCAFIPSSVARRYRMDAFDFSVLGFALFVVGCWIAVTRGYSVNPVIRLLLAGGPAALVVRICLWVWAAKTPLQSAAASAWSTAKAIFLFNSFAVIVYALHYHLLRPQILPFVISGNLDLFQYANNATVLRAVGGSLHGNVAGYDFRDFAMRDVFGAFSLFSLFQSVPRTGAYDFAVPAVLLTSGGMSVAILGCLKRVFQLDSLVAFFAVVLALANPLNFYVVYNFFLAQLITTTLITFLIIRRLRTFHDTMPLLPQTIARLPFYIAQVLTYAPGLVMMLVLDGVVSSLVTALRGEKAFSGSLSFRTLASIGTVAGSVLLAVAVSLVVLPERAQFVWNTLLAYAKPGIAGWPLPLVSPYILLGVGGLSYGIERSLPTFFAASYWLLIPLVLLLPPFLHVRGGVVPKKWRAAFVAEIAFALTVVGYAAYYLFVGLSYQQWKLASYGPAAFCWIGLAEIVLAINLLAARFCLQRFPLPIALSVFSIVFLLLDIKSNSRLISVEVPASIASISAIDRLPIKKIAVDFDSDPGTENYADQTLVPSLVTRPTLYMTWGLAYPRSLPPGYRPSPEFPLLTSGGNCGKAGEDGVEVLGDKYVLVSRNTLPVNVTLDFSRSLSCAGILDVAGVSAAERTGRWTDGNETRLHLYLSSEQLRGDVVMTLVAGAYVAPPAFEQSVEVVLNGRSLAVWDYHSFSAKANRVVIPHSVAVEPSGLDIVLKLPNAVSMMGASQGQDHRVVALMLHTLQFSVP